MEIYIYFLIELWLVISITDPNLITVEINMPFLPQSQTISEAIDNYMLKRDDRVVIEVLLFNHFFVLMQLVQLSFREETQQSEI